MTKKAFKATSKLAVFVALVIMAVSLFGLISACGKKGEAITLDVTEKTIYVADKFLIEATTREKDADVTWTSSDDNIASVKRGTVTGVAVGEATITATLDSGESATCVVTVSDRTVTISEHTKEVNYEELGADKSITLTATCSSGEAVTWSSSDTSVATVANGVVTFSQPKKQVATVTISAQKGAASDECVITVKCPSIPEDYYELMKETNANVIANPGVWYYHADGAMGTNYRFAQAPAYGGGKLTADLDIFPKLEENRYFRFRYQPDMEEGTKYTIKFTVTLNIDAKIGFGTNAANGGVQSQSVQANIAKNMVYIGTVNTPNTDGDKAEPFHININQINGEVTGNVTFLITNITIKEYAEGDENQIEEDLPIVNLPEEYNLERGTTTETCNNPGKWYYMIDPADAATADYTEAKYDHGVVTLALAETLTGKYHQLRIRPAYLAGTKVTATFTVSLSAPGTIYYALNNENTNRGILVFGDGDGETPVGTEVVVTRDFTVSSSVPFVIWIEPGEDTGAITMTVKNASFEERLPANYTVTFDSKGGSEVQAQTVAEGEEIKSAPAAPEKGGFVFDGWYESEDCSGEAVAFPYTPAANVTLYAKWLNIYTVTYEANDGTAVAAATVTEGNAISELPVTTREGYTFLGWYDKAVDGNKIIAPYAPEGNVTLYAYWVADEVPTYTVSFESNGGSAVQSQTVTEGESVTLTAPEKEGFVFGGWYEDEDLTVAVDGEEYIPEADSTLYAKWLEIYTVSFEVNHNGSAAIESEQVTEGESITLTEPSRKAFTFGGWYADEQLTGEAVDLEYAPTANVILYAKWTAQTEYTIQEEPDKDSALAMHNRDAWYYELNGTQSAATVTTAEYNDGVITFAVTGAVVGDNGQNSLRLAYAPDLAKGAKYTLTFKVTVNAAGKYKSSTLAESGNVQSVVMAADTEITITYSGTVGNEAYYFNFYNTTGESDVTITVKDITVTVVDPEVYDMAYGLNGTVRGDRGVWYWYAADQSQVKSATYNHGTIELTCENMDGSAYCLRYRHVENATFETVSFKVKLSGGLNVEDYITVDGGKSGMTFSEADADGFVTVTVAANYDAANTNNNNKDVYYIQFQDKSGETTSVTMTVKDVVFTEKA